MTVPARGCLNMAAPRVLSTARSGWFSGDRDIAVTLRRIRIRLLRAQIAYGREVVHFGSETMRGSHICRFRKRADGGFAAKCLNAAREVNGDEVSRRADVLRRGWTAHRSVNYINSFMSR